MKLTAQISALAGGQSLLHLVRELLYLLLRYTSFAVENDQEASVARVFKLSILNGDITLHRRRQRCSQVRAFVQRVKDGAADLFLYRIAQCPGTQHLTQRTIRLNFTHFRLQL